ncbi:hypothetical protein GCM10028832_33760 [Streptomyces sparsus]
MLRAVFQRLPLPVVLLDRDSVVRRLNPAASRLFGMREGYASARGLTGALAHAERAAFRSQVAAVARDEGGRSLTVRLLRPPEQGRWPGMALRTTLTPVLTRHEPHTLVVAVFQQDAGTTPEEAATGGPGAARGASERVSGTATITRHTELMDLVDEMTATLLRARSADEVAAGAGDVLRPALADWVVVDLAGERSGSARRVAVATGAGREQVRQALAAARPEDSPLIEAALRKGAEALQLHPEDPEALGRDAHGASLLGRTEVGSLLCVPLRTGQDAPVLGVLTLLRLGTRRPFELAEAGVADRIGRHLALALDGR